MYEYVRLCTVQKQDVIDGAGSDVTTFDGTANTFMQSITSGVIWLQGLHVRGEILRQGADSWQNSHSDRCQHWHWQGNC